LIGGIVVSANRKYRQQSRKIQVAMGDLLVDMPVSEAQKLDKQTIFDLIGIPLTINRVKCATLSLKSLLVGLVGTRHWEALDDDEE